MASVSAPSNGPQFSLTGSLRIGAAEESIAQGSGEIKYGVNCHCGKIALFKCDSCKRAGYCGVIVREQIGELSIKLNVRYFKKKILFTNFYNFA